jgi:hypothetical protein
MSPDLLSRRTIAFVNIAHALDHFVVLIYPTAVIAIAAERQLSMPASSVFRRVPSWPLACSHYRWVGSRIVWGAATS